MSSIKEVDSKMEELEENAHRVLASPNLTPIERRQLMMRLLRQYRVQEQYKSALAAYISRMRTRQPGRTYCPEEAVRELLTSPEYACLQLVVLAVMIAVVYGDGPRAAWVPVALLPRMALPLPGLRR